MISLEPYFLPTTFKAFLLDICSSELFFINIYYVFFCVVDWVLLLWIKQMLKGHEGAQVDIIDRLPTPFGLVRSGVAPDHPETKVHIYHCYCLILELKINQPFIFQQLQLSEKYWFRVDDVFLFPHLFHHFSHLVLCYLIIRKYCFIHEMQRSFAN